ncbi:hypothetical protein VFPPC_08174 [Pochonia chlamydosporia 170]|uniref:Uncharacterized protein n=1 Tax=Pochonia chlamydosporia 170 TaxID=1380566 RepID=A0A179FNB7_METCM|nr:hypothetical protein VFPPC_08174 [Pochonia chlamydosporia 170]OAQ66641.1 hypothetical protein VFPPC_08174 [Pochonia chlamydosporia 170]
MSWFAQLDSRHCTPSCNLATCHASFSGCFHDWRIIARTSSSNVTVDGRLAHPQLNNDECCSVLAIVGSLYMPPSTEGSQDRLITSIIHIGQYLEARSPSQTRRGASAEKRVRSSDKMMRRLESQRKTYGSIGVA